MSAERFELKHFAAFKLIEGLYKKGIVDKETFENVKAEYPEFFQEDGGTYRENVKSSFVKVADD